MHKWKSWLWNFTLQPFKFVTSCSLARYKFVRLPLNKIASPNSPFGTFTFCNTQAVSSLKVGIEAFGDTFNWSWAADIFRSLSNFAFELNLRALWFSHWVLKEFLELWMLDLAAFVYVALLRMLLLNVLLLVEEVWRGRNLILPAFRTERSLLISLIW